MSEVKRDQLHAALMEAKATLDAERAELAKVRATCDMLGKERNEADEAKYHAELRLSALQGLVRALDVPKHYVVSANDHGGQIRLPDGYILFTATSRSRTYALENLLDYVRALDATPTERFTKEELAKWWHAQCSQCGWDGLSRDCAGGEPLADTGDYADPICPMCDQTGRCVVVDDYVEPTGGDGE